MLKDNRVGAYSGTVVFCCSDRLRERIIRWPAQKRCISLSWENHGCCIFFEILDNAAKLRVGVIG